MAKFGLKIAKLVEITLEKHIFSKISQIFFVEKKGKNSLQKKTHFLHSLLLPKSKLFFIIHCDGRTWWLLSAMNPIPPNIEAPLNPSNLTPLFIQRELLKVLWNWPKVYYLDNLSVSGFEDTMWHVGPKKKEPTTHMGRPFWLENVCFWLQLFILVQ